MRIIGIIAIAVVCCCIGGSPVRAQEAGKPGDAGGSGSLFEPVRVIHLDFELPKEGIQQLRENHKAFTRATLREGKEVHASIGLRLKGSVGSFRPLEEKPGFTVKLNQFQPNERFHGLRKFQLNNAVQDPTYLSEYIGNILFNAALVPAPMVTFARVRLNNRDLGLYVLIEGTTREFLARHFLDPNGNLYEGPGEITDDLDTDSRGGQADRTDLRELARATQIRDPAERLDRLEKQVDIDRFLSFLAVEMMAWHWDGYTIGVNNYRLYHDPMSNRMTFMPHGTDQLFQDPNGALLPEVRGRVAQAVLSTDAGRKRYRERIGVVLDKAFGLKSIRRRADAALAVIQPVLKEIDAQAAREQEEAARNFLAQIAARIDSIREQVKHDFPPPPPPPAPPATLEFDGHGIARLPGWEARVHSGSPRLDRQEDQGLEGKPALHIAAGEDGSCTASWRTRVVLPGGRYLFRGQARVENATPRGEEQFERPSGACLRISGRQPEKKLLGTQGWKKLEFEIRVPVNDVENGDPQVVELVCELQAGAGQAWFDLASLQVVAVEKIGGGDGK